MSERQEVQPIIPRISRVLSPGHPYTIYSQDVTYSQESPITGPVARALGLPVEDDYPFSPIPIVIMKDSR